jgi:hypothetical protein
MKIYSNAKLQGIILEAKSEAYREGYEKGIDGYLKGQGLAYDKGFTDGKKINENESFIGALNDILIKHLQSEKPVKSQPTTDELLDAHNDYIALYNMFGDSEYLGKAEGIIERMKGSGE